MDSNFFHGRHMIKERRKRGGIWTNFILDGTAMGWAPVNTNERTNRKTKKDTPADSAYFGIHSAP